MEDGFGIGEQLEDVRADDDAGCQIAQHGAEAEAAEDRHGDDACSQQGDRVPQIHSTDFMFHCWVLGAELSMRRGALWCKLPGE